MTNFIAIAHGKCENVMAEWLKMRTGVRIDTDARSRGFQIAHPSNNGWFTLNTYKARPDYYRVRTVDV